MNPRQRRLEADYRELRRRFDGDEAIVIQPEGVVPPEKYTVIYRIPSLRLSQSNEVVEVNQTVIQISLPATYPRERPYVTTVDPVFHPNFGLDNSVCIADHWTPSLSLADIVVRVGEMLQMMQYNIQSPLNAAAAEWAVLHRDKFPLSHVALGVTDVSISLGAKTSLD